MSNKQKFEIIQSRALPDASPASQAFYKTNKWFITVGEFQYLHADGVIRVSTFHDGAYLGYYKTREEAREAIRKYKSLQSSNKKVTKCRV